ASFPFVSPAVELPMSPTRRVADAGYSDNYGVEMAALWMYKNKELVRKYTSGVLLVQIRAYRLRFTGKHLAQEDPRKYDESKFGAPPEVDGDSCNLAKS